MAVSLAIKTGRLVRSVVRDENNQPKISSFELADQEWDANTMADRRPLMREGVLIGQVLPPQVSTLSEDPSEGRARDAQRKLAAEADLKELELKTRRGKLVDKPEVKRLYTAHLTGIVSKVLSVPSRCKQQAPELTLVHVALIEALLREALDDAASAGIP